MVGTTIVPAIQYLPDRREDICEPSHAQWPYKSPQSWACLQISIFIIFILEIVVARDWFRFDLRWSRKRQRIHQSS